jgi:hypothetical protein
MRKLLNRIRRRDQRVDIDWTVRAKGGGQAIEFSGYDLSLTGIRLKGQDNAQFRQIMDEDGQTQLALHIPGHGEALWVRASLCWGLGQPGHYTTGWHFKRPPWSVRRALAASIREHSTRPDVPAR